MPLPNYSTLCFIVALYLLGIVIVHNLWFDYILYYNTIYNSIIFSEYVVHQSPFAPHTYYICDFDNYFGICWCTQTPVLHQHICYICIYVIELCMLMPANHILHHILVKFASLHNCNLTKFSLDKKTLIHL